MPDMPNMFPQLRQIMVTQLKLSADTITPDTSLEEAELDSLGVVELSLALQSELGLEVSDDEMLAQETVGGIARLLEALSAAS